MSLQDVINKGVNVTDDLVIIPPNLNVLVEVEKHLGDLARLSKLMSVKDFRFLLFALAKVNRAFFDGEEEKPKIALKKIGKMIKVWDLEDIAKKLNKVIDKAMQLKNSQRSTQDDQKSTGKE